MRWFLILAIALLAGCTGAPVAPPEALDPAQQASRRKAEIAVQRFVDVVRTVQPVAEEECRKRTSGQNCTFQIVVDDRPDQEPNAFQTTDRRGRPVLAFNIPMIASVRNADELAFVMGHEAAHHILGHIGRTRQSAIAGAVILSGLAALSGASAEEVRGAEELGAAVGARRYSKDFELEADELGTVIAFRAGYDPIRGAKFFSTLPDPGEAFLGSHPPNAARIRLVNQTVRALKSGS